MCPESADDPLIDSDFSPRFWLMVLAACTSGAWCWWALIAWLR